MFFLRELIIPYGGTNFSVDFPFSFFPFGGIRDRFEGQSAKPPNGELGEDSDTHTALHIGDYSILANEKTLKNTTRWAPSPVIDWLRTLLQVVFFSPQLPFLFSAIYSDYPFTTILTGTGSS